MPQKQQPTAYKPTLPNKQGLYAKRLQQCFLLASTQPLLAQQLLASGSWQAASFGKGETIYGGGLWQGYLGLMIQGRATAYSTAQDSAAILRTFQAGDVFGAAALYTEQAEPFSHIVADQKAEAIYLPQQSIQQLMAQEPQVAENYLRFLAQRAAFLNHKITALTAGAAKNRLAMHIAVHSQPDNSGLPVLTANINKLAQTLGLSRTSLYRSLEHLLNAGCIERQGKTIIIVDYHKLMAFAQDQV